MGASTGEITQEMLATAVTRHGLAHVLEALATVCDLRGQQALRVRDAPLAIHWREVATLLRTVAAGGRVARVTMDREGPR